MRENNRTSRARAHLYNAGSFKTKCIIFFASFSASRRENRARARARTRDDRTARNNIARTKTAAAAWPGRRRLGRNYHLIIHIGRCDLSLRINNVFPPFLPGAAPLTPLARRRRRRQEKKTVYFLGS